MNFINYHPIAFLGDHSVGKTSIIVQFLEGMFPESHIMTRIPNVISKYYQQFDKIDLLRIFDMPCEIKNIREYLNFIDQNSIVAIVIDTTSKTSVDNLSTYLDAINGNFKVVVVYNKIDKEGRVLNSLLMRARAQEQNFQYFEMSARNHEMVVDFFDKVLEKKLRNINNLLINLNQNGMPANLLRFREKKKLNISKGIKLFNKTNPPNDFTFIVGDKKHKCNRLIIDIFSPVVAQMHASDSLCDFMVLDESYRNGISWIMQLLKLGHTNIDIILANDIYKISMKLGNIEVADLFLPIVKQQLDVENIAYILLTAINEKEEIIEHYISFIAENFEKVQGSLYMFGIDIIEKIIRSNCLHVSSENVLLKFVQSLGLSNLSLLDYVHFDLIEPKDLVDFLQTVDARYLNPAICQKIVRTAFAANSNNGNTFPQVAQRIISASKYRLNPHKPLKGIFAHFSEMLKENPAKKFVELKCCFSFNGCLEYIVATDQESSSSENNQKTDFDNDKIQKNDVIRNRRKNKSNVTNENNYNNNNNDINRDDDNDENEGDMKMRAKNEYWEGIKNISAPFLLFNFKGNRIMLTSYSIQSANMAKNNAHMRSWTVLGSDDRLSWTVLDQQVNNNDLNEPLIIQSFDTKSDEFFQYIKITMDGISHSMKYRYRMMLRKIEFFGKIVSADKLN